MLLIHTARPTPLSAPRSVLAMQQRALAGPSAAGPPGAVTSRRSSTVRPMAAGNGAAAATAAPAAVSFVRRHLLDVPAYTPIEPFEVLSARYGKTPQQIVKLDANENPYGPPPEVRQALQEMPFPHIYPDPETRQLRAALSSWSGVPVEYLMVRGACALRSRSPAAAPIAAPCRRMGACHALGAAHRRPAVAGSGAGGPHRRPRRHRRRRAVATLPAACCFLHADEHCSHRHALLATRVPAHARLAAARTSSSTC